MSKKFVSVILRNAYFFLLTRFFSTHCAWNGHGRSEKMASQIFVLFCILMGILKLKKYLKIFSTDTTFYVIKEYAWIFLSVFLVILQKKFFWLQPIFGPSWWVLAKKSFLRIFIWKKHAKWYQWKKFSGIFLASVCPKEYKNGKIFDRRNFRTSGGHFTHSDYVFSWLWNKNLVTFANRL